MKKSFAVAAAVFLSLTLLTANVFADEVSAVWRRLYGRARSLDAKYTIMLTLSELDDPSLIPLLEDTLADLNASKSQITSTIDNLVYNELVKLVVKELGDLRDGNASQLIYDVVRNADDPYLAGTAIVSLGKVGDVTFADDIALILRNINLNYETTEQDKDAEVVAYACVLALKRLKEPVGYSPLFFASIGWYSSQSEVKEAAEEAMNEILPDPTDILVDLVKLEADYAVKYEALLAEGRSLAPPERISAVATEALNQGLIHEPKNTAETSMMSRLRLKAMEFLINVQSTNTEPIKLLDEMLYLNLDINEKLTVITALGANGSDDAVETLVRFLNHLNVRQSEGVVAADYRVVRAVIKTLGESGNSSATEELTAVKISGWTPAIAREADAALENLKQ